MGAALGIAVRSGAISCGFCTRHHLWDIYRARFYWVSVADPPFKVGTEHTFARFPWQMFTERPFYFANSEFSDTFAFLNQKVYPSRASLRTSTPARMAESVDALVSNTSGAIRAGSIPAPGTIKSCK